MIYSKPTPISFVLPEVEGELPQGNGETIRYEFGGGKQVNLYAAFNRTPGP
jgi:hypothetical protein